MNNNNANVGSFRDPSGCVYIKNGRVFRTVMPCAAEDFKFVEASGLINSLEKDGLLVQSEIVDPKILGESASGAHCVLEHPPLPFISYPYEWSFSMLKAAGLAHLNIHLKALEYGVTLSDASAYNIQFVGSKPIFIDRLSFRQYRDGEFWLGHKQFSEQFINPLLLRTLFGIPHNAWYRGTQEGITSQDLVSLLPWWRKLSMTLFKHVVLPATLQKRTSNRMVTEQAKLHKQHKLPVSSFSKMLIQLKDWIERLEPLNTGKTVWGDYAKSHSYSSDEVREKQAFIAKFVEAVQPQLVWDLGCNTGDYSAVALKTGAKVVIGFDFDQRALELAFLRAKEEHLTFLPLFFDAANPSPNQGWAEMERPGMKARASANAILALAFVHHLAISRNIPLPNLIKWLTGLAPQGVIEFIPKSDPMVQQLLSLREDIFDDYSEERFLFYLSQSSKIVESKVVSDSGRRLIWYTRQ